MTLNKKPDFVEPERLSLKPLKRLIAIFMIAMIAFACSRSDRHVSLPTNNNPNKPGYQDGGSGLIIPGVDFTFNGNVNQLIKAGTSVQAPVKIQAGTYKISTIYYDSDINWTLTENSATLFTFNSASSPKVFENVIINANKQLTLNVSNTGELDTYFTVSWEPQTRDEYFIKLLQQRNSYDPSVTYNHKFENHFPGNGQLRIGAFGSGGAVPELKCTLTFPESTYLEPTNSHTISLDYVSLSGSVLTSSTTITQQAAPNDNKWDIVTSIPQGFQTNSNYPLQNAIVAVKDEEGHRYRSDWRFRWFDKLPQLNVVSFTGVDYDSWNRMEFEFDRVFTPEEQALITKVGAIKLTLLGVNFSPVSIEDFYGCYNRMAFTLPTSITETMLPNLETLPFKLAVNVSAADAEFIGLSTGENALAPTNFWSLPSYIGYDANWLKTQGSEAHSLASDKELSSEKIGCFPCNETKVNPPTPIRTTSVDLGSTNSSAVIADVERKKSGSNADCCVVDIMAVPFRFYPTLEINTKMVHNAHTCADYHWVKYQHNPKHTCSDKIYANAPITLGKPAYVHHYLDG